MLGVGNGELIGYAAGAPEWSSDPLATVQQADDYASARGWSDWAALQQGQKSAAILDASTFIKVTYQPPRRLSASQSDLIVSATVEAARLALSGPLLGAVEEPQVLREKLKDLETTYAEAKPGAARTSRLALVSALLRSAGLRGGSTVNVPLRKA